MTSRATVLAITVAACASTGDDVDYYGSSPSLSGASASASTTGNAHDDGDGTDETENTALTGSGDTSGAIVFDVGAAEDDTGGGADSGCRGIDFLFVVDNSGSMLEEQLALVTSFPGFIEAIDATIGETASDFHVMVIDTDDGASMMPSANPGTCEWELGAGLVSKPDYFPCGLPDGQRYLTDADENLPGAFSCLAYVGTVGASWEQPMAALGRAVGDLASPGGCNAGFLRDDAILVVTVISDEEDIDSPGGPNDWLAPVLAAKGGVLESIVMLGLLGDSGLPGSPCEPQEAENATDLRQFVAQFGDGGLWASVCEDDYAPFFESAIAVIDAACDDFVPPG